MFNIIVVIAGCIYVICKLFEERKDISEDILTLSVTITCSLIGSFIITKTSDGDNLVVFAIGLVVGVVFIIGGAFLSLFIGIKYGDYRNERKYAKRNDAKLGFREQLIAAGFANVDDKIVNELLNDYQSPFGMGDNVDINKCYRWMCDKKSREIDNLKRAELEGKLGLQIMSLPLDEAEHRSGYALLKRTQTVKHYLLKQKGLKYWHFARGYILDSDDYTKNLIKYIDDKLNENVIKSNTTQ